MQDLDIDIINKIESVDEKEDLDEASNRLFDEAADQAKLVKINMEDLDLPEMKLTGVSTMKPVKGEDLDAQELIREKNKKPGKQELNSVEELQRQEKPTEINSVEEKAKMLLLGLFKDAQSGSLNSDTVRALQDYYGKHTDVMGKINSHLEDTASPYRVTHHPKTGEYELVKKGKK